MLGNVGKHTICRSSSSGTKVRAAAQGVMATRFVHSSVLFASLKCLPGQAACGTPKHKTASTPPMKPRPAHEWPEAEFRKDLHLASFLRVMLLRFASVSTLLYQGYHVRFAMTSFRYFSCLGLGPVGEDLTFSVGDQHIKIRPRMLSVAVATQKDGTCS